MLELCHIIRDGVVPITPTGGESFQLGVDAISDLAMKLMALRGATRWINTAPAEAHLAAQSVASTTPAEAHLAAQATAFPLSAPFEALPAKLQGLPSDIDMPAYSYDVVISITLADGNMLVINPYYVTSWPLLRRPS